MFNHIRVALKVLILSTRLSTSEFVWNWTPNQRIGG